MSTKPAMRASSDRRIGKAIWGAVLGPPPHTGRLLFWQSDPVQGIDNKIAVGLRQRRHALLHLRQRELRIFRSQRPEASARFGFGPGEHIGRTKGSMHPVRRRMPDQSTLLPPGRFGIIAGREMRTADTDHIVECERVLWREVERYLEAFYR